MTVVKTWRKTDYHNLDQLMPNYYGQHRITPAFEPEAWQIVPCC